MWPSAAAGALAGALFLPIAFYVAPAFAKATAGRQTIARGTQTVLEGVFTTEQAERGASVFAARCATCHEGADVDGPPLTGAPFIDRWREDTLDGVFEFMKTEMPQRAPGSLTDAVYLDILAHLLHENSYPPGPHELTLERLNRIQLLGPNGPQPLPSGAVVAVAGCLTQNAAREWMLARATAPARARVGTAITRAEAATAAAAAFGNQAYALQNLGESGVVPPNGQQKVLVKGPLSQRAGTSRIYVTAAQSVAASCV